MLPDGRPGVSWRPRLDNCYLIQEACTAGKSKNLRMPTMNETLRSRVMGSSLDIENRVNACRALWMIEMTSHSISVDDAPDSPAHVFHLATPQHMLTKFWWELQRLKEELQRAPESFRAIEAISYCAFNTAVTALHCADWAWRSLDEDEQRGVAERFGFRLKPDGRANLTAFLDAVCKAHKPISICRHIANGSKHMGVDKPTLAFNVRTVWEFIAAPGEPRSVAYLVVEDDSGEHRVEQIFASAFEYWERLFGELFLIERNLVESSGRHRVGAIVFSNSDDV
jgi:hypothetical protein